VGGKEIGEGFLRGGEVVDGSHGGFHEIHFVVSVTGSLNHFGGEEVEVKGHVHLKGFGRNANVAIGDNGVVDKV
jgi:hypothetical protein